MVLLTLVLFFAPLVQPTPIERWEDGEDWQAVWSDLARLRSAPADQDASALRASLSEVEQRNSGDPRADVLAAHLAQVDGAAAEVVLVLPPKSWPFVGAENWLVAEVHAPHPQRAEAILRALAATPGALAGERLRLAWGVGVEEALARRLQAALEIQEALHSRYQAAWSAADLALTASRAGAYGRSDAVLAAQIAVERATGRPTGSLWSQRGIAALGSGDERRARDYLGSGCAQGSADAAVVLARLDLDRGRLAAARAGFRALLPAEEPSPWAARGWGMALLPDPEGARARMDMRTTSMGTPSRGTEE
ncbi:MAG: hypothetical protein O7B99_00150 [Planctomycetota bacterium]|nr:hypothetical protein [Planctomycetota bacterium]